jgi:hypothetical protein
VSSKRNLRSDDVDGFMLAIWDSCQDLATDYQVRIEMRYAPAKMRGHLVFDACAYHVGVDGAEAVVARAEAVWPTHYSQTVHALLYALLVRLWRELDQWRDIERLKNSAPLN